MAVGLLLFAISLFVLLYAFYRFAYAPYQTFQRSGVQGPTPLPFLGHYLQIRKMGIAKFEMEVFRKYGTVSGYYVGRKPTFLIADTDMIKEITIKQFDNFMNNLRRPKVGAQYCPEGLLLAQGEDWRTKKKVVTRVFSVTRVKQMLPLIQNSARTLVDIMKEKADSGKSFDIARIYCSFTMETILATALGRAVEVQRGESNSLVAAANIVFEFARKNRRWFSCVSSSFPWVDPLLAVVSRPFNRGNFTLLDPLLAPLLRPGRSYHFLYSTVLSLVRARRQAKDGETKYKDLLQLVLDATEEEEADMDPETSKGCPAGITEEGIVNITMDILLAGFDTTANSLCFITYLLALNPDIQGKLRSEITNYFQETPDASLHDASSDIKYLDMVIMEAARLHPAAPRAVRVCNASTRVCGVHFPKGCTVILPIHIIHRNPAHWPEPEKFDPERFSKEEKSKRPQLSYMPFGSGQRTCIGRRLALLQIKVVLIELLKKFTFIRSGDTEVPLSTTVGLTMSPVNGVYLKITAV